MWKKFLSNKKVLIEEIQKVTEEDFPEISEKFHCNPKEFQREGVVGVVLMREEKAFSEKEIFTSRTKLCCSKES